MYIFSSQNLGKKNEHTLTHFKKMGCNESNIKPPSSESKKNYWVSITLAFTQTQTLYASTSSGLLLQCLGCPLLCLDISHDVLVMFLHESDVQPKLDPAGDDGDDFILDFSVNHHKTS